MIRAHVKVLSALMLFAFFLPLDVFASDMDTQENPYAESRAAKCTTMSEKSSFLPMRSVFIDEDLTRSLMDNSSDDNIGAAWASTAALRDRSLHLRFPRDRFYDESSQIAAQLFIDAQTDRARAVRDIINPEWIKKHFGSILTDPDILAVMDELAFAQENIGFMLHAHHMYKRVGLSVDVPLHVGIAHPWLSFGLQDKLKNRTGGSESDTHILDPKDEAKLLEDFKKIYYTGGLGDLKVAANIVQPLLGDRVVGTLGLEVVIPLQSAKSAAKNLSFDPVADDFNPTIFTLPWDHEEAKKFAFRMLEYVKAIGTNPVVGQKCFSLGATQGIKIYVHPSCTLHQSLQVQYNFPVKEYRIIHRYRSDNRVASNLAVEPGEFLVSSSRGLIINGSVGIRQNVLKNITLGLFGDLFWQNNENFREIFTDAQNLSRLLPGYAEMGSVKQLAVRMSAEKKFSCAKLSCSDVRIGLDAGVAFSSSGIGKLWHAGLSVSGNF